MSRSTGRNAGRMKRSGEPDSAAHPIRMMYRGSRSRKIPGLMSVNEQPASRINTRQGPLVVAYDGSAASRQAVVASATLMGSFPMLVVTVWEEGLAYVAPPIASDQMAMAPMVNPAVVIDVDREMHQHAERISRDGAELARSLNVTADPLAVSDEGSIPATILRVASERHAVAIVVGLLDPAPELVASVSDQPGQPPPLHVANFAPSGTPSVPLLFPFRPETYWTAQ